MTNRAFNIAHSISAMRTSIAHLDMGWARTGLSGIAALAARDSRDESDDEEASR